MSMTSWRRLQAAAAGEAADRVPLLAEGVRDDVRRAWAVQGLPVEANLDEMFHYDVRHRLELDAEPRPAMEHPPLTPEDRIERRARLAAADADRLPQAWAAQAHAWRAAGHIVEIQAHAGLFLTLEVEAWASLEPTIYLIADKPRLVRQVMDDQAALNARLIQRVLAETPVDMALFSEPIADNHGPLVSPNTYRELALASYRPILDLLHAHRVPMIVWITYGNSRLLIGDVLDAGFNFIWAIETESQAMDYRRLRRQFGRSLGLIGGIDLDCLLKGLDQIDDVLRKTVPPLVDDGRYLPLADGRVRANMPFAHYAHYRRRLESIVAAAS